MKTLKIRARLIVFCRTRISANKTDDVGEKWNGKLPYLCYLCMKTERGVNAFAQPCKTLQHQNDTVLHVSTRQKQGVRNF